MSKQQRVQSDPLTVLTNSFSITRLPTKEYHQYADFEPEQKIRRRRHEIIHELQVQYPQHFNPRFAYDGNAILYASRILDFNGSSSATLPVTLTRGRPRQGRATTGDRPKGVIDVRLTRTQAETIKPFHLNALIQNQGSPAAMQTTTATNLLQLIIRQGQNWTKYPNNSRAYFTDVGSQKIGGGFELWRGFFQSVRPSVGRMLINIDISMAAMYRSGDVLDIALEISRTRDVRDLAISANHPKFRALEKYFKKRLVTVDSPAMVGARKTVYGLEARGGRFSFEENGQQTTVADYFQHKHNIRIKYPDIFGFVLSPKSAPNKNVVPAELCKVIPGQMYRGKIPEDIQSGAVQKFATMRPSDRLRAIQTGMVGNLQLEGPAQQYQNNDIIADAAMEINLQPLSVHGRVLRVPQLVYGGQGRPLPRNGAWNVVDQQFYTPESLPVWGIVNFVPDIRDQVTRSFVEKLRECCARLGMRISECAGATSGSPQAPEKSMNEALSQLLAHMQQFELKPPSILVVVILPQNAAPIRAAVKYWGDIQNGVITQCVREAKIWKGGRPAFNDQYCNNVALKLNARLGGTNSIPRSPTLDQLKQSPFMIMGADVGHPGPGIADKPSVTSLVFSHDHNATHYAAITRVQPPRQEIIVDLAEMVSLAITAFGRKNKAAPAVIIFYRDGVSEGEYEIVAEKEIKAIKRKLGIDQAWAAAKARDPKPQLTFIVVGKRHHVRFFPPRGQEDKSGNCPAGFVADTGLQSPFCTDFYLLSHGGLLGTSRPSHYIILHDEHFNSNMEDIQSLSFALCHAYCKATRSVSIPAPVYYADLVCSRAAFYFDASLDYAGSDVASVSSGGVSQFNLGQWRDGYRPINGKLIRSMYFL